METTGVPPYLNRKTAVHAFLHLRANHLVSIDRGMFKISDEPLGEPPILLQQQADRGWNRRQNSHFEERRSFSHD